MSVFLRPLQRADLPELARLHAVCFPDDAWDMAALHTVLGIAGASGQLACSASGDIWGFIIDQCIGDDAEVLTLGVVPGARRGGIARRLMLDLIARARTAGVNRVVLEVAADNEAALALYRALGFVSQGRRRNYYRRATGPNVDAWRLSLDLSERNAR